MKILFVHQNIPGQYRNLAPYAAKQGHLCVFLCRENAAPAPAGVHKVEFRDPPPSSGITHHYVAGFERAVLQGQENWRVAKKLRDEEGFTPDVIVGHPGWGDMLYLKDLWPNVPMLSYFEFYYRSSGLDVGFDPADLVGDDDKARVRTKNALNLMNLEQADWGISPTWWQRDAHPKEFHSKISVMHDGIDVQAACPNPLARVNLGEGKPSFGVGDEVVTYIARNMEPYRGTPTFIKAAEIILKKRPNCHIIAIGSDGVSYGKQLQGGDTYLKQCLKDADLDMSRIHFVGRVPYDAMLRVLQISSAHIYLTYPFVLSWSFMEAMAAGCVIIGSSTPPVMEVIEDGYNGLLVDFFSPEDVAAKTIYALDNQEKLKKMRQVAREYVVDRYALEKLMPLHMELVEQVARRELPPPVQKKIDALYIGRGKAA